jgi:hypothetical protein
MTYAFLTAEDVLSRIRDQHRNDLRDVDPLASPPDPDAEAAGEAIELSCESMALAKVRSALAQRYDTAALFTATGTARSSLLVLHVLNVFVYLLYRRINPRKVPEVVKEDHDETLAWLDRVAAGKEAPDFPEIQPDEDNAGLPRFGGGQQLNGIYY